MKKPAHPVWRLGRDLHMTPFQMHEMGIACSVLTAVGQELERYPGRRAAKVEVRIGEFAGAGAQPMPTDWSALVDSVVAQLVSWMAQT